MINLSPKIDTHQEISGTILGIEKVQDPSLRTQAQPDITRVIYGVPQAHGSTERRSFCFYSDLPQNIVGKEFFLTQDVSPEVSVPYNRHLRVSRK